MMKILINKLKKIAIFYWVTYQKGKTYKEMTFGIKLKKLTKEQKRLAQKYYKEKTGRRINLKWHRYYYTINGLFTPEYLSVELYHTKIIPALNDTSMSKAYADKNITSRLFHQMVQPKAIIKNMNGFYYENDKPISKSDAIALCHNLADAVIKSTMDTAQGKSIIRFSSFNNIASHNNMPMEKLFDLYGKNFIVQEAVKQHPILASLNPTSLNTVRLTTFRRETDVVVLFSLVRMGKKGAKVDNVSAGGLFCKIHPDGHLDKYAYSTIPTKRYEKNELGVEFGKITIPYYSQIVEKAKSMHLSLPYTKIVGWDITVNDNDEVVLIELNLNSPAVYQLIGPALGDHSDEILSMIRTKKLFYS